MSIQKLFSISVCLLLFGGSFLPLLAVAQTTGYYSRIGGDNYCGDGVLQRLLGEECDDDNYIDGDGCSSNCEIEGGEQQKQKAILDVKIPDSVYIFQGSMSTDPHAKEIPVHGDGVVDSTEGCDEGENNGIVCEPGYGGTCTYCSNGCELVIKNGPACGDGLILEGKEECDDGNLSDGDGCSHDCKKELTTGNNDYPQYISSTKEEIEILPLEPQQEQPKSLMPSTTDGSRVGDEVAFCGNTIVEETEECDDGNGFNQDGCSSVCKKETFQDTLVRSKIGGVNARTKMVKRNYPSEGIGITQPYPHELSKTGGSGIIPTAVVFSLLVLISGYLTYRKPE